MIALRNEGFSIREIAKKLHLKRSTVSDAIKMFCETGSNKYRVRSGRPRVTLKSEDQSLVLIRKRNRKLTAPKIQVQNNRSHEQSVSVSTVQRRLRSAGLWGRVAVRKPLLRHGNKQKCLKWAMEHRNWTIDDWKKVLWTDESKFEVFGNRRRVYVRRSSSEKMHPDCVTPTVKHGGGSVMVWGCFSYSGVGHLHRVQGILNKEGYHSILQRHAIPSGLEIIGKGFIMQQGNDQKHTSKFCTNYLRAKQRAGDLFIMEWPPQSPDLNPIELLWDELDRMIRQNTPTSEDSLFSILQTAWREIPLSRLENLALRMPRLVRKLISVKGGFFDEKTV